ncbi:hypothetical protein L208DRAFT_1349431 [Tricholoma matsutake]|nr:hypothetical protein L208DRAFT_1349431 [Tricholoma matsutake 945]
MYILCHLFSIQSHLSVCRVHWLRSWAQSNRWKEELLLVTYKMQWTMHYFMYHSQKWCYALISDNTPPGSVKGEASTT